MTNFIQSLGNEVTGNNLKTESEVQNIFATLLLHPKSDVVKEAAWTVSNITAGPPEQIQAVIQSGCIGPFVPLIEVLANSDSKFRKEAAWANMTSGNFFAKLWRFFVFLTDLVGSYLVML